MRLAILTAATLALVACNKNAQKDASQNLDAGLTADNIVANDITAIDAVTGDAANMAADVDYSAGMDNSLDNEMSNAAHSERPKSVDRPRPRATAPETKTPTATPAGNALSNSGD